MNLKRYTIRIVYTENKTMNNNTKTKIFTVIAASLSSAIHLAKNKFNVDMKGHEVFNCYAMDVKI